MKQTILSLSVLLLFISACNDAQIVPLPDNGTVVASINHVSGDQNWAETFEYDNQGRIKTIENQASLGRLKTFHYAGDLLTEVRTIGMSDDRMIFRDSITYNLQGQVSKIYNFSVNGGEGLPLHSITTFTYDLSGQLIESNTDNLNSDDYNPRKVYHWKDGNVVQEDQYWDGENISLEFYYRYDDKIYLNTYGYSGYQYTDVATRNNVTEVDWTDHTGLYDTACKPCTTDYTYANDRPVAFVTNWHYGATITYKEVQRSGSF